MLPASLVALIVACFVQMRVGKEMEDDPEYRRRVAAGELEVFDDSVLAARELPPYAKRSTMIFLAGIAVIVVLGNISAKRVEIDPGLVIARRIRIAGSGNATYKDVRIALHLLATGAVKPFIGAVLPSTCSAPTIASAARTATGTHCGQFTVGTNSCV